MVLPDAGEYFLACCQAARGQSITVMHRDKPFMSLPEHLMLEEIKAFYIEEIYPNWTSVGNLPHKTDVRFGYGISLKKKDVPSMYNMSYAPALSWAELVQIVEICKQFMELNKLDKITIWDNTAGWGQHIFMIGVICDLLIPGKVTVRASDARLSSTAPDVVKSLFPMVVEHMTAAESLQLAGNDTIFFTAGQ